MNHIEHCLYTQLPVILHPKCEIKTGRLGFLLSINGEVFQKPTEDFFTRFSLSLQNMADKSNTYTCYLHRYAGGYIFDTQSLPEALPAQRYRLILGIPHSYTIGGVTQINDYPKTNGTTTFIPCGEERELEVETSSAIVILVVRCNDGTKA